MQDTPIYAYFVSPLKLRKPIEETIGSCYTRCCAHCFRSLKTSEGTALTLTCPSCSHPKDAAFCSSKCQSLAFSSSHTPWVCRTLSHLRNCSLFVNHQTPEDRQIEARCLVAVFNLAMVSPYAFQTFLSLDGCGARDGQRYIDSAIFLHSIFTSISFDDRFSLPSVEMIADILAKDWRNSFCLMDPFSEDKGRSVRGHAVYLNASFFNHSCLPSACHFHYLDTTPHNGSTDLIIRVMHDIPQGEEICISYLRVNISYSERQRILMNDYTFACSCKRCQIEANWSREEGNEIDHKGGDTDPDFLHAYLKRFMCKRESCRGFLAPLPPSDDGNPSGFMECNFCRELTKRQDESDGGTCVACL